LIRILNNFPYNLRGATYLCIKFHKYSISYGYEFSFFCALLYDFVVIFQTIYLLECLDSIRSTMNLKIHIYLLSFGLHD